MCLTGNQGPNIRSSRSRIRNFHLYKEYYLKRKWHGIGLRKDAMGASGLRVVHDWTFETQCWSYPILSRAIMGRGKLRCGELIWSTKGHSTFLLLPMFNHGHRDAKFVDIAITSELRWPRPKHATPLGTRLFRPNQTENSNKAKTTL